MIRKYAHSCPQCPKVKRFWTLKARLNYGLVHLTLHRLK